MNRANEAVDVAFVIEEDGGVVAVMPGLAGDVGRPETATCYVHVGGHSSCSIDYIMDQCDQADHDECADLLAELGRVGYDVSVIPMGDVNGDDYAEQRLEQLGL